MRHRPATDGETAPEPSPDEREPRWWHRDHPEATALAGFFCGVLTATVVPGAYAALLGLMFDFQTAERLFPYVLVVLAVPLALLARPETRRFGRYMLLGIVLTALVVVGVASAVLWYMVRQESG